MRCGFCGGLVVIKDLQKDDEYYCECKICPYCMDAKHEGQCLEMTDSIKADMAYERQKEGLDS